MFYTGFSNVQFNTSTLAERGKIDCAIFLRKNPGYVHPFLDRNAREGFTTLLTL